MTAIMEHLVVEHGRCRLFHVDGPATAPDAKVRRLAMKEVIAAHPPAELTGSYTGRFSVRSGENAGEQLLADVGAGGTLPDAIVCANDQMAIGVLRALVAHGVRVPGDVAVVGFDDIFPAGLCDPPLTTVHQPIRLMGERACDRLFTRITNPALRPKVELLPTELVLRSSCGCPPGTVVRRQVKLVRRARSARALEGSARARSDKKAER
jgi:LacI family transcriptional regulator